MAQIIIEDAGDSLDPDLLRAKMNIISCGSIVSFIGLTRGKEQANEVNHLENDAWIEQQPKD